MLQDLDMDGMYIGLIHMYVCVPIMCVIGLLIDEYSGPLLKFSIDRAMKQVHTLHSVFAYYM